VTLPCFHLLDRIADALGTDVEPEMPDRPADGGNGFQKAVLASEIPFSRVAEALGIDLDPMLDPVREGPRVARDDRSPPAVSACAPFGIAL